MLALAKTAVRPAGYPFPLNTNPKLETPIKPISIISVGMQ